MQIQNDKVATLHYTLTDNTGAVLDKSEDGSFVYLHGYQSIIPGLENALEGREIGDDFNVKVPPEQGYGVRNEAFVQDVPRSMFQDDTDIEVGMQFNAQGPNGEMLVVTVIEAKDETVIIDANHPLAGVELNFDIKVVDIRDASAEEIEHGHVHGEHTHHN